MASPGDDEKSAVEVAAASTASPDSVPRGATDGVPATASTSSMREKETKETKVDGEISNDTDDASEDADPYNGVAGVDQTDLGLSAAEKGITTTKDIDIGIDEDDEEEDNDNSRSAGGSAVAHQGRISATFSRIASNASSAVRRNHLQEHELEQLNEQKEPKEQHLAVAPVPLSDLDKGIVGWDSPDDPAFPLNFSPRRRWLIIIFLASMTLMTPFASTILAPGINFMDADFGNDSVTLGSLAVSIYLL